MDNSNPADCFSICPRLNIRLSYTLHSAGKLFVFGPGVRSILSRGTNSQYLKLGERTAFGSPTKQTPLAPISEIKHPETSQFLLKLLKKTAFPPRLWRVQLLTEQ